MSLRSKEVDWQPEVSSLDTQHLKEVPKEYAFNSLTSVLTTSYIGNWRCVPAHNMNNDEEISFTLILPMNIHLTLIDVYSLLDLNKTLKYD